MILAYIWVLFSLLPYSLLLLNSVSLSYSIRYRTGSSSITWTTGPGATPRTVSFTSSQVSSRTFVARSSWWAEPWTSTEVHQPTSKIYRGSLDHQLRSNLKSLMTWSRNFAIYQLHQPELLRMLPTRHPGQLHQPDDGRPHPHRRVVLVQVRPRRDQRQDAARRLALARYARWFTSNSPPWPTPL